MRIHVGLQCGRMAVVGDLPIDLAVLTVDRRHVRVAQPGRRFDQRVEHGLKIEGRAADDLEHVGGGGLLLQRFAQLVEQPGVLDGDDGLRGEILHQRDLLIGERPHLLAVDSDPPDQLVVLEHRHDDEGASAGQVEKLPEGRVGRLFRDNDRQIGDMDCLFVVNESAQRSVRAGLQDRVALAEVHEGGRRIMHRRVTENRALAQHKVAELRAAEARRIGKQLVEHRLQVARRGADDAQHLRCRRLLLQRLSKAIARLGKLHPRFGEFLSARFELPFQLGGRFRGCVQRARSHSFWSKKPKSHLVGTVTGPLPGPGPAGSSLSSLTEPHDELPLLYSITTSARASNVGGTSRPRALAVLRLMTSSYLVGCTIGRSPGWAP